MAGELENQRITRLTPLHDVLASIKASVAAVAPRTVDLNGALNHVLAEDVTAAASQPGNALALRDGYAVRAEDIVDAGSYAPIPLAAAPVRVDVGGVVPPDADAVVPLDAIVSRGACFEALASAAPGDGVLPGGGDLRAGAFIARRGWRLNGFNLAMLAMAGRNEVSVREPRIRLVKAHAAADPVIDAVSDLLARALNAHSCSVQRSSSDLAAALADASHDAVIAIGGTGSGRSDTSVQILSVQTLAAHGTVIHGIAISPGETAAFGMAGNRPVLLLPGRFDAAMAGWLTVGRAMCERLCAGHDGGDAATVAKLARKVASPIGLVEVVPVRLAGGEAEPIASGYWPLGLLADTDGWLLVPAGSEGFPAGSEVVIRPWP